MLDQDPLTGALRAIQMSNVDMSGVDGLWIPCNSSVTPWMTHADPLAAPNATVMHPAHAKNAV